MFERLDIIFDDLELFVKKICVDDMGKEVLKEKLMMIYLINIENNDEVNMELKDNILYLIY